MMSYTNEINFCPNGEQSICTTGVQRQGDTLIRRAKGNGSSIKNLEDWDLTIRPWSVSASFNESEEPKLSHLTKVRNVMKSS